MSSKKTFNSLILHLLYILTITLIFLLFSRNDALIGKMAMRDAIPTSGFSFDILINKSNADQFLTSIFIDFVNWCYSNWKGMVYGLLMGGALSSLFDGLSRKKTKSEFINTIIGLIAGSQIGICANCVAPVANSLLQEKASKLSALSLQFSSPTFNIIVLSTLFSLFPLEIAIAKVAANIIFIIFILSLVHLCSKKSTLEIKNYTKSKTEQATIFSFISTIIKKTLTICRKAIPYMLAAGLIGAIVFNLMPMEQLSFLPHNFLYLLPFSLIVLFMPVPITFDIIFSFILFNSGLPISYVAASLFGLGIYSIYPFILHYKLLGKKISLLVFSGSILFTFSFGMVAQEYWGRKTQKIQKNIFSLDFTASELITNIKKQCTEYTLNDNERISCLENTIYSIVPYLKKEDICHLYLSNKNFKSQCLQSFKKNNFNFYQQKCSLAISKEEKSKCWKKSLINLAKRSYWMTSTHCPYATQEEREYSCKDYQQLSASIEVMNRESCSQIKSNSLKSRCVIEVQAMRVIFKQEVNNCNNSMSSRETRQCLKSVYKTSRRLKRLTPGLCKLTKRKNCLFHYHQQQALITRSEEYCRKNLKGVNRFKCVGLVLSEKVSDNILKKNALSYFPPLTHYEKRKIRNKNKRKNNPLLPLERKINFNDLDINIYHLNSKRRENNLTQKVSGPSIGIYYPNTHASDFMSPFNRGRCMSAADVNNDHFPDILLATNNYIRLFINQRNGSFEEQEIKIQGTPSQIQQLRHTTLDCLLVDLNGDHSLDIVASTYGGANYYLKSIKKKKHHYQVQPFPSSKRVSTRSIAIADLDGNSKLEVVFGNWTTFMTQINKESSRNEVFTLDDGSFKPFSIPLFIGETLSALSTDLNNDQRSDLITTNANEVPDHFYVRSKNGKFSTKENAHHFPITPFFTMSADSGDINNDGLMDLFFTDMSFERFNIDSECDHLDEKLTCNLNRNYYKAIYNQRMEYCHQFPNQHEVKNCQLAVFTSIALRSGNQDMCSLISKRDFLLGSICKNHINFRLERKYYTKNEYDIPQTQSNVLLLQRKDNSFKNVSESFNVLNTHWSWNSKFLDYDNDSYLDIYIANGDIHQFMSPNIFLKNNFGKKFSNQSAQFSLDDTVSTSSYLVLDIDMDGNLDIVSSGVNTQARVFMNKSNINKSLYIKLKDFKGLNSHGIGSTVKVVTSTGKTLTRELKASGGFISHNDYTIHFGLGEEDQFIKEIQIYWPNQKIHKIKKMIKPNTLIEIVKKSH